MNRIDECINLLTEALLASREYQEYQEMRERLRKDPEKERQVNEFRRKSYLLQNSKEALDLYQETERLQQESAPLREQTDVNEYLEAELALCRMVQHINYRLMQEIDFD